MNEWQWVGPISAAATVISIGLGHHLVRKTHARFGPRPGLAFFLLGLIVVYTSLNTPGDLASSLLGIFGITFLWDGLEMFRQERRMQRAQQRADHASHSV
jgi:hypothetical protein